MRHVVIVWAVLVAGCPDRSISTLEPDQAGTFTKDIATSADIDLLFVIDNSGSTRDKQTIFAQNFVNFVAALDRFPTGRPNLHIGVVTTTIDVGGGGVDAVCRGAGGGSGQDGVLQRVSGATSGAMPSCLAPGNDRFFADLATPGGGRMTSYAGALKDALACTAQVGDTGCGFEAPLEAMKRALDGSRPENAGFLRRGAFLAVVVLTDEDDCSADPQLFQLPEAVVGKGDLRCAQTGYRCDQSISPTAAGAYTGCGVRRDSLLRDPAKYAQFLSGVKGASRVAVAVIGGPPTTSVATGAIDMPFHQDLAVLPTTCSAMINGKLAIGRPGLRLDDFVHAFGNRGLFRTVCQSDYSQALDDIGTLLFHAVSPCLEGTLDTSDTDPATPGLQPDCAVSEWTDADTASPTAHQLPRCAMTGPEQPDLAGQPACWWVTANPAGCTTETHLELHIERSAPPPPDTTVRVSCLAAPT